MKIKLIILAVVIGLVVCGEIDGVGPFSEEICLKGVTYYKGHMSLAPAFKQDGTLYTCEVDK